MSKDWDGGTERRSEPREKGDIVNVDQLTKVLNAVRAESHQFAFKLGVVTALIALAVAAASSAYIGVQITNATKAQVRNGVKYNCDQQAAGRVQGRVRAFAQENFLLTSAKVRELSADAEGRLAAGLENQLKAASQAGTPSSSLDPIRIYVRQFRELQKVSETAAAYWNELAELIEASNASLPQIDCESALRTDEPPPVPSSPTPDLPQPPSILQGKP